MSYTDTPLSALALTPHASRFTLHVSRLTPTIFLPMADDFNSSDIEFDLPPPDRYTLAGAHSVDAILNNASTLRIESKKAVKQLQSVNGAPITRIQRA